MNEIKPDNIDIHINLYPQEPLDFIRLSSVNGDTNERFDYPLRLVSILSSQLENKTPSEVCEFFEGVSLKKLSSLLVSSGILSLSGLSYSDSLRKDLSELSLFDTYKVFYHLATSPLDLSETLLSGVGKTGLSEQCQFFASRIIDCASLVSKDLSLSPIIGDKIKSEACDLSKCDIADLIESIAQDMMEYSKKTSLSDLQARIKI